MGKETVVGVFPIALPLITSWAPGGSEMNLTDWVGGSFLQPQPVDAAMRVMQIGNVFFITRLV